MSHATAIAIPAHSVIELRQYTLQPGQRDTLIDLFDREFLESQEALGMRIVGQFRDLDHPDRFVWLRSFADMPARAEGLNGFYFGPVWQAHRAAANATMIDSDNVLLLRPLWPGAGFRVDDTARPGPGATGAGPGLIVIEVRDLKPDVDGAKIEALARRLRAVLTGLGGALPAWLTTEPAPNNFPRLPVREGECVLVSVMRFAGCSEYDVYRTNLQNLRGFRVLTDEMKPLEVKPSEVLRLQPTARSRLRG